MERVGIAASPRRWWALGALAVSLLTVGLDLTVLNVAVPTLATELHASTSQLQWFATAYTLVLAAVLLPAGLLGDRYGQKKLLVAALAVFGLASAACAFAGNAGELIAARAALGIGAAFLIPLSMSMLNVLFAPEERARALTIWVLATFVGIPLGPVLGGWLLDNFAWGSVFLINVPLALVGLLAVIFLVPPTTGTRTGPIDVLGIGLSSAGLAALTYGFVQVGERGWGDGGSLGLIGAGVVLLAAFGWWQTRVSAPLVDLTLFGSRGFTWGAVLATVASFALMGLMFVLPQLFQAVQGTDALGTGLRLLPLIGGMLVGSKIAERFAAAAGIRVCVLVGFALIGIGLGVGTQTAVDQGYGVTVLWEITVGLGTGCTLPPLMTMAIGALRASREASGSALIQALRQVGGTIGVSMLGTVLNAGYRSAVAVGGLPGPVADAARGSAAAALAVAARFRLPALADSARTAFLHGMATTFWACAGVAVLGAVLTALFVPGRTADIPVERPQSDHDVVPI